MTEEPPSEFDFSKPENWTIWLEEFDRYISIADLEKKSDKEKVDLLCYCMGEKSKHILKKFFPEVSDREDYEYVKGAFISYFLSRENFIYQNHLFNLQKKEECVDQLINELLKLENPCESGSLKNELISNEIVAGLNERKTSELLQLVSDLNLEKAITIVLQAKIKIKENKIQAKENKILRMEKQATDETKRLKQLLDEMTQMG